MNQQRHVPYILNREAASNTTKMNRSLTILFFSVILILGVSIWLFPRILALSYQVKGGMLLESSIKAGQVNGSIACNQESPNVDHKQVFHAIAYLEKSLEFDPQLSQVNYLLGRGYCLLGQWNKARERFTAFIEQRPRNPLGYLELGFIYASKGNQNSSRKLLTEAGVKEGNMVEAGRQLSQIDQASAITWFERALWLDPNASEAMLGLGNIYELEGLLKQALQNYRKAWAINPEIATQPLANLLIRENLNQEADSILQEALNRFPHSTERRQWWITLGESLESQGKWRDLIQVYLNATDEYPSDEQLLIKLGWAYFYGAGDSTSAQNKFMKASEVNKDSGEGYSALGQMLSKEKKYREAGYWLKQAIQLAPDNRWYQLYLANNTRDSGELDAAFLQYQDLLSHFPDFENGYWNLAWNYRLNQDKVKSIETIEKYISLLNSPGPITYYRIADFFEWAGEYQKALEAYNQAHTLDPQNQDYINKINQLQDKIQSIQLDNQREP